MTEEETETQQPCPPYCDWPRKGVHFEAELLRLSVAIQTVVTRMDTVTTQLEVLIRAEKLDMEDHLRRYVDGTTQQIKDLSEACRANAEACKANAVDIASMKGAMAKSVAIYGSLAGFFAALIPAVIEILRGKF
jgi:hypothetical protein